MMSQSSDDENVNIRLLPGHRGEVNTCCISPNRDIFVTAGDDGLIYFWKAETGTLLARFTGHKGPVNSCVFTPCASKIVSGSYDGSVKIWDICSQKCIMTLKGHCKSIECVSISRNGKMIASVSWDKSVILWDVSTGFEMKRYLKHTDCVSVCAFSYNYDLLATGGWDCKVIVWKLDSYKDVIPAYRKMEPNLGYEIFSGHVKKISALCFSSASILASGSWDRTVKLWNFKKRQIITTFTGHTGWVKALAFTKDSIELASAADDGSIRVWNIPNLKFVRELRGETDVAVMCQFSADGDLISSGTAKDAHVRELVKIQSENARKEEIEKLDV